MNHRKQKYQVVWVSELRELEESANLWYENEGFRLHSFSPESETQTARESGTPIGFYVVYERIDEWGGRGIAKVSPCLVEGHVLCEAVPFLLRDPENLKNEYFGIKDLKHHEVVTCARCGQLFSKQILEGHL